MDPWNKNTKNWAFTLQIPSFKQVTYNNKRIQYGKVDFDGQMVYLKLCLDIPCERFADHHISYDVFYEKHSDGRLHAHGTFFNLNIDQIECIQKIICEFIGFPRQKQWNQIFNFLPIFNDIGWEKYKMKEVEPPTDEDRFPDYSF